MPRPAVGGLRHGIGLGRPADDIVQPDIARRTDFPRPSVAMDDQARADAGDDRPSTRTEAMSNHCCEAMSSHVNMRCDVHDDPYA
ncbi:hypothetical protein [Streptomyces sp. NPDC087317]|uniref:hypothetical protein n=1 Tax=Streptomyces sp. NPDC087317 TaxID=3365784 RepID=UPI00382CB622